MLHAISGAIFIVGCLTLGIAFTWAIALVVLAFSGDLDDWHSVSEWDTRATRSNGSPVLILGTCFAIARNMIQNDTRIITRHVYHFESCIVSIHQPKHQSQNVCLILRHIVLMHQSQNVCLNLRHIVLMHQSQNVCLILRHIILMHQSQNVGLNLRRVAKWYTCIILRRVPKRDASLNMRRVANWDASLKLRIPILRIFWM